MTETTDSYVSEQDFALVLRNIITDGETPEEALGTVTGVEADISRVDTFEGAMVLTMDAGLVIRLSTGAEFQLTVKRSA